MELLNYRYFIKQQSNRSVGAYGCKRCNLFKWNVLMIGIRNPPGVQSRPEPPPHFKQLRPTLTTFVGRIVQTTITQSFHKSKRLNIRKIFSIFPFFSARGYIFSIKEIEKLHFTFLPSFTRISFIYVLRFSVFLYALLFISVPLEKFWHFPNIWLSCFWILLRPSRRVIRLNWCSPILLILSNQKLKPKCK